MESSKGLFFVAQLLIKKIHPNRKTAPTFCPAPDQTDSFFLVPLIGDR